MKITIELPDDLCRRAKAKASLERRKLRDLIEEGLRTILENPSTIGRRPQLPESMKRARGIIDSGVDDLGSNPKHLSDFGRSRRDR
jgi:hypothetical protein